MNIIWKPGVQFLVDYTLNQKNIIKTELASLNLFSQQKEEFKIDKSQTTVLFEKPGNLLVYQLMSLVAPGNTDFTTGTFIIQV